MSGSPDRVKLVKLEGGGLFILGRLHFAGIVETELAAAAAAAVTKPSVLQLGILD
jgi:hypothetical protein